jgi:hypothetical protein
LHLGSLLLAPEPGLDPLDDLLVGLGDSCVSRAGVRTRFSVAELRQQGLSGLGIAGGSLR